MAARIPERYRRWTFDALDVDRGNREAVDLLREWSKDPFAGSLFIQGNTGGGKTLGASIALVEVIKRGLLSVRREFPVRWGYGLGLFVNVADWLEDSRNKKDDSSIDDAAILVLDDIGAENPTGWTKERIFTLINRRYEMKLPMIITSNLTLPQLSTHLTRRTSSRIAEMCKVVTINGVDRRFTATRKSA